MMQLRAPAVYYTEEVERDAASRARMDRMMPFIHAERVQKVTDEELCRVILANGWHMTRLKGEMRPYQPPPILFSTFRWPEEEEKKKRLAKFPALAMGDFPQGKLAGYMGFDWRGAPKQFSPGVRVCQPGHEMHTIAGCPFRCDYCAHLGEVIVVLVNLEDFVSRMDGWLAKCPDQTLFKWDNATDAPCFEPEYGGTKLFVDYFARRPGKYLLLYLGKCADIDYLLDYDHRGKTIVAFSISGETQSTVIEKGAAPTEARIEAARKCQEAGYLVRVRFSPVIPVRNWRDENRRMVRSLLSRVRPDVISLCLFGWMDTWLAKRSLDLSLWDGEFLRAMDDASVEMFGKKFGPLPHEARAKLIRFLIDEIRGVSPEVPIALCLESLEMWQQFGPELGMRPERYFCNCGPQCTPGTDLYREFARQTV